MLSKAFRLSKDRDFKKVFKSSKPFYCGNLILRYSNSPKSIINNQKPRIGFIVSNKIDKRATKRNELKRKMRSVVFLLLPKIKQGYDIIFTVSRNFQYPYQYFEIEKEMINILKKADLLYD